MSVETGTEAAHFFSGNICFEFSVLCLCSVGLVNTHSSNGRYLVTVNVYHDVADASSGINVNVNCNITVLLYSKMPNIAGLMAKEKYGGEWLLLYIPISSN